MPHFRRSALLEVGAWDAWNVTEDADLGMRLARAGYRTRVLDATTWEEAPNRMPAWLGQRTRWLKGWMQTYAVHMRRPGDLLRRLGLKGFLAFQLLIGGMVASALVHPLFVVVLAAQVLGGAVFLGFDTWLLTALVALGAVNLAVGYGSGFAMALVALRRRPMRRLALELSGLPVYWLLNSVAAYRAIWDLARRPFGWQKTEHGLSRTVAPLPRLGRRRAGEGGPGSMAG